MVNIFIIGATGHIGGAVLDLVHKTYPDAKLVVLVRDQKKGDRLVSKYPGITPIIGDLNSFDVLEKETKNAEIVINAGPDVSYVAAIKVILKALAAREKKGFYIHTSGAASTWNDADGSTSGKIWDDVVDLTELRAVPDSIHKVEDETVASAAGDIYIAVISPTLVYGLSPSIDHPIPLTFEPMLQAVKGLKQGFIISSGQNILNYIHVVDQAKLYLILLSDAMKSLTSSTPPTPSFWGAEAYYFGGDEELSFAEYMTALVKVLKSKGIIETEELKSTDVNAVVEASGVHQQIALIAGVDMRVRSTRGMAIGWKFEEKRVRDTLEEVTNKYLEMKG